jgi:hypothetical protein
MAQHRRLFCGKVHGELAEPQLLWRFGRG